MDRGGSQAILFLRFLFSTIPTLCGEAAHGRFWLVKRDGVSVIILGGRSMTLDESEGHMIWLTGTEEREDNLSGLSVRRVQRVRNNIKAHI